MTKSIRTPIVAVVLLAATIIFGISNASGAPVEAAAFKNVTVGDNFFSRSSTTIKAKQSIRFTWDNTSNRHQVSVRSGPVKFKSKTKSGVFIYTRQLSKKGTYKLNCTIHPDSMKTTVKVK